MSSASDPATPLIGSKQHYDALLNGPTSSVGTTTRKRNIDESDLERLPELGEPFTIEVKLNKIYSRVNADGLDRLHPQGLR